MPPARASVAEEVLPAAASAAAPPTRAHAAGVLDRVVDNVVKAPYVWYTQVKQVASVAKQSHWSV